MTVVFVRGRVYCLTRSLLFFLLLFSNQLMEVSIDKHQQEIQCLTNLFGNKSVKSKNNPNRFR